RVEPQYAQRPAVRLAQALETLNGRRLAGPIRSQDAEDFALFNREGDVAHGLDVAVALGQMFNADDGRPGKRKPLILKKSGSRLSPLARPRGSSPFPARETRSRRHELPAFTHKGLTTIQALAPRFVDRHPVIVLIYDVDLSVGGHSDALRPGQRHGATSTEGREPFSVRRELLHAGVTAIDNVDIAIGVRSDPAWRVELS